MYIFFTIKHAVSLISILIQTDQSLSVPKGQLMSPTIKNISILPQSNNDHPLNGILQLVLSECEYV